MKTVASVPIRECGEPLVDIRSAGGLLYGPPPECPDTAPDYCLLRRAVYRKLLRVQQSLPLGLSLRLYEGLRSLKVQAMLFDQEMARVRARHPQLSAEQLHTQAAVLVSPVMHLDGSSNIPPHSTGGAVDIEIVDANGKVIDFGMAVKDWVSVAPAFCATAYPDLSAEAAANRLLLAQAMERAGFANYVNEWWHYSYGDRYWASRTGKACAIYGSCTPAMTAAAS
jgi:zinc D-Ala-D-Ala dipeptidase